MSDTRPAVFATLFRGFLLGVGFCIAASGFAYVGRSAISGEFEADATLPDSYESYLSQRAVTAKDYRIDDLRKQEDGTHVWIVGKLTNTGKRSLSGIELQGNLYMGETFVDQYSEHLSGAIKPGESRLFKISCGCKDKPPAAHDSFKVVAVGGY